MTIKKISWIFSLILYTIFIHSGCVFKTANHPIIMEQKFQQSDIDEIMKKISQLKVDQQSLRFQEFTKQLETRLQKNDIDKQKSMLALMPNDSGFEILKIYFRENLWNVTNCLKINPYSTDILLQYDASDSNKFWSRMQPKNVIEAENVFTTKMRIILDQEDKWNIKLSFYKDREDFNVKISNEKVGLEIFSKIINNFSSYKGLFLSPEEEGLINRIAETTNDKHLRKLLEGEIKKKDEAWRKSNNIKEGENYQRLFSQSKEDLENEKKRIKEEYTKKNLRWENFKNTIEAKDYRDRYKEWEKYLLMCSEKRKDNPEFIEHMITEWKKLKDRIDVKNCINVDLKKSLIDGFNQKYNDRKLNIREENHFENHICIFSEGKKLLFLTKDLNQESQFQLSFLEIDHENINVLSSSNLCINKKQLEALELNPNSFIRLDNAKEKKLTIDGIRTIWKNFRIDNNISTDFHIIINKENQSCPYDIRLTLSSSYDKSSCVINIKNNNKAQMDLILKKLIKGSSLNKYLPIDYNYCNYDNDEKKETQPEKQGLSLKPEDLHKEWTKLMYEKRDACEAKKHDIEMEKFIKKRDIAMEKFKITMAVPKTNPYNSSVKLPLAPSRAWIEEEKKIIITNNLNRDFHEIKPQNIEKKSNNNIWYIGVPVILVILSVSSLWLYQIKKNPLKEKKIQKILWSSQITFPRK